MCSQIQGATLGFRAWQWRVELQGGHLPGLRQPWEELEEPFFGCPLTTWAESHAVWDSEVEGEVPEKKEEQTVSRDFRDGAAAWQKGPRLPLRRGWRIGEDRGGGPGRRGGLEDELGARQV